MHSFKEVTFIFGRLERAVYNILKESTKNERLRIETLALEIGNCL